MFAGSNSSEAPILILDSLLVGATLRAAGHRVVVLRVGPDQAVFQVFGVSPTEVLRIVRGFYEGEAVAAPLAFDKARGELRRELDAALHRSGRGERGA